MFVKSIFVILSALFMLSAVSFPKSAQAATITLSDFQAVMTSSIDPGSGNETISLLVDSSLFGTNGIADGMATVGVTPPDETLWLVDPFLGTPPAEGMTAIGFQLNPAGEVMGIRPEPFRIFLGNLPDSSMPGAEPTLIGLLDFSGVTGSRGSLNLSGVNVLAVGPTGMPTGEVFNVEPFTIHPVPEPSTLLLCLSGLACWAGVRRDRKGTRHQTR